MRIQELLEGPINTSIKDRTVSGELRPFSNKRINRNTPMGVFSNVTPDADPHMVKKSSNQSMAPNYKEGFRLFIEFIVKNKLTDNPHMPRVYNVHKIVGADGYTIDSFKTEKLLTHRQVKLDEISDYIKTVLGEDSIPEWVGDDDVTRQNELFQFLAYHISDEVHRPRGRFTLESLNEACEIVAKVTRQVENLGGHIDLHYGNILFRRTPFGLQAVLNDPIYIPD